ncbi:MAG TPA: hypothetical protein VGO94_13750 [Mycobacteriales bacterium]|jgi:hypothetical protein|nr:hypothetical protein [Mycobacteriales bacterium]
MSQPNTSEPTEVGAEVADEAAESSAGAGGGPGAAERAGEPVRDAPAADDGTASATPTATGAVDREGEGLPGLATGTAGGNGIGGGEGSTSGPVDPEDSGTTGG